MKILKSIKVFGLLLMLFLLVVIGGTETDMSHNTDTSDNNDEIEAVVKEELARLEEFTDMLILNLEPIESNIIDCRLEAKKAGYTDEEMRGLEAELAVYGIEAHEQNALKIVDLICEIGDYEKAEKLEKFLDKAMAGAGWSYADLPKSEEEIAECINGVPARGLDQLLSTKSVEKAWQDYKMELPEQRAKKILKDARKAGYSRSRMEELKRGLEVYKREAHARNAFRLLKEICRTNDYDNAVKKKEKLHEELRKADLELARSIITDEIIDGCMHDIPRRLIKNYYELRDMRRELEEYLKKLEELLNSKRRDRKQKEWEI